MMLSSIVAAKGDFIGPSTCFAKQGTSGWFQYEGKPYLVPPELLRELTEEENRMAEDITGDIEELKAALEAEMKRLQTEAAEAEAARLDEIEKTKNKLARSKAVVDKLEENFNTLKAEADRVLKA